MRPCAFGVGHHLQKPLPYNSIIKIKPCAPMPVEAVLAPEAAGGPYQLQVKGNTAITLKGILMGDLWVCSGQSNMEMPLNGWGQVYNYEQEIASANYPSIRLFTVEKDVQGLPVQD